MISASLATSAAHAEDGYDLWLRYRPVSRAAQRYRRVRAIAPSADTPTLSVARGRTAARGLDGLVGRRARVATPRRSCWARPRAARLPSRPLNLPLKDAGDEGYLIRSGAASTTVIAANSDVGVLYGVFAFLRLVQTGQGVDKLDILSARKVQLRLLNHWDNLDGHVERGYAGQSLWDWWKLPDYKDPRYVDYARANASIGINGTVLNNVNAKAESLTAPYIAKVAALADVFRPYGIKVFLSARLSAPDRDRRPEDRRPAGPGRPRLVEGQGRRDLQVHPRFRRLPGEGQFRGPAGSAGLRPHPRRRGQHAGRRGGAAWRRS